MHCIQQLRILSQKKRNERTNKPRVGYLPFPLPFHLFQTKKNDPFPLPSSATAELLTSTLIHPFLFFRFEFRRIRQRWDLSLPRPRASEGERRSSPSSALSYSSSDTVSIGELDTRDEDTRDEEVGEKTGSCFRLRLRSSLAFADSWRVRFCFCGKEHSHPTQEEMLRKWEWE